MFVTAAANNSEFEAMIEVVQIYRAIANKYKDLNASIWEANAHFVDQVPF